MHLFYNLKIATKLLASFAVMLCLCIGLGVFSMAKLAGLNQTTVDLGTHRMPGVQVLLNMKGDLAFYRVQELQHILSSDPADMAVRERNMIELATQMRQDRTQYATLISEADQQANYDALRIKWEQYSSGHDRILNLSRDNRKQEALELIEGVSKQQALELRSLIDTLAQISIRGAARSVQVGAAVYASSRAWIIAVLAGCVVIGSALALWVARLIALPLTAAVKIAQTVAAGDLTSRIDIAHRDETGLLLIALQQMNNNLVHIVGEVRDGSDGIASAATQIASGNQDLAARTEKQASSLEETASSIEELTTAVKQNADNARRANSLAVSASEIAFQGGAVVSRVVGTMGSINESAKKITDIIGVIDSIAFQTNILALNAAVEAARAGEQGRGFAVVATEVRNLAQRSAAAAKEIKFLIDHSVKQVDIGSELVAHAGITMQEIVAGIGRVTDIMAEITTSSAEQSAGIEQVNQAISQMDQTTQQNASLVEDAATAAEALQARAVKLVELVGVFELHRAAPGIASHSLP